MTPVNNGSDLKEKSIQPVDKSQDGFRSIPLGLVGRSR